MYSSKSVVAGWQTMQTHDGKLIGPAFHKLSDLMTWQRDNLDKNTAALFEFHAARAFFASAWDDLAEECDAQPWPPGAEIMEYMPDEIDPAALHAAKTLRMDVERVNGKSISELMAHIETIGDGDRPNDIEHFGHYAAMQAMGHGVGLHDAFGGDVYDSVKIPYCEFSSCSLEKDYFTAQGE
jgi:hypothetical protein